MFCAGFQKLSTFYKIIWGIKIWYVYSKNRNRSSSLVFQQFLCLFFWKTKWNLSKGTICFEGKNSHFKPIDRKSFLRLDIDCQATQRSSVLLWFIFSQSRHGEDDYFRFVGDFSVHWVEKDLFHFVDIKRKQKRRHHLWFSESTSWNFRDLWRNVGRSLSNVNFNGVCNQGWMVSALLLCQCKLSSGS